MSDLILKVECLSVKAPTLAFRSFKEIFSKLLHDRSGSKAKTILDKVNFEIFENDSIGLVGRNGAGKTTLARTLAGIIQPDEGKIVSQQVVRYLSDSLPEVDANLSGLENASYLAKIVYPNYKSLEDFNSIFKDALEFSELGENLRRPIRTYSYGMKKRLMNSIQSMYSADIMILDEFSLGTDEFFEKKINARIDGLVKKTKAVIWVNHDDQFLVKNCRKGILIEEGRVIKIDSIEACLDYYKVNAS